MDLAALRDLIEAMGAEAALREREAWCRGDELEAALARGESEFALRVIAILDAEIPD